MLFQAVMKYLPFFIVKLLKVELTSHGCNDIAGWWTSKDCSKATASIKVNGKEYAKNTRGYNIVVFDNKGIIFYVVIPGEIHILFLLFILLPFLTALSLTTKYILLQFSPSCSRFFLILKSGHFLCLIKVIIVHLKCLTHMNTLLVSQV